MLLLIGMEKVICTYQKKRKKGHRVKSLERDRLENDMIKAKKGLGTGTNEPTKSGRGGV